MSAMDTEALWSPPAEVAGKYLGPFLVEHFGLNGNARPHAQAKVYDDDADPPGSVPAGAARPPSRSTAPCPRRPFVRPSGANGSTTSSSSIRLRAFALRMNTPWLP